jgi:hypothetical protein
MSGTQRDYAVGIDQAIAARHELQHVEAQIARKHGREGVIPLRDALGRGITMENIAKERGEGSGQNVVAWYGGLFRRYLRHLAEVTGFAVRNAYENQRREDARQTRERERQEGNRRERKRGAPAASDVTP